ncbi:MAG: hypothetical protein AAF558_05425 [Verrucomicrobiota bacterium]
MQRNFYRIVLVCLVFLLFWVTESSLANTERYYYQATPSPSDNFTQAAFSCWIPKEISPSEKIRGVMVVIPSQDADGRDAIKDSSYKKKCKEWKFALVGCYFKGGKGKFYSSVKGGSGRALRDAFKDFSTQSDRRELYDPKMVLIGFSAGAQFAYSMACDRPEDVIAFCANKGVFFTSRALGSTYRTPGLFITNEGDETESLKNTKKIFKDGRGRDAHWAHASRKGGSHKFGNKNTKSFILTFIEETFPLRIKETNPSLSLERLRFDEGFFVDASGKILPGDNRKLERDPEVSWVASELLAEELVEFSSSKAKKK